VHQVIEQVEAFQVCITPKAVYESFQKYFDYDHQVVVEINNIATDIQKSDEEVLGDIKKKVQNDVKEFHQAQHTLVQLGNQVKQIIESATAPPNKGATKKTNKRK